MTKLVDPPKREVVRMIDVRGHRGSRMLACVLACGHWVTRRRPPGRFGVQCIGCVVEAEMADEVKGAWRP